MKKNNKKGFMLIETLLVATFVLGVLTYLFIQFSALKRNYDDSFKYNTVPGLYGVKNINQYISKYNGYSTLTANIDTLGYTEFKCAFISGATCKDLLESIKAEKIYLAKDSVFKNNINTNLNIFSENDELYRFVKKINFEQKQDVPNDEYNRKYHLIVEYNNGTYASMVITI